MKKIIFLCSVIFLNFFSTQAICDNDSIVISGIVTDFEGNPVDSAFVEVKKADFSTAYYTFTDINGNYHLKIAKGKYLALASMKLSEYPLADSKLSKDKQRLEFWCWNLVATENLTINVKYHRLEVYGVNVFKIQGATPGFTIYCRPMSLTRGFSEPSKPLSHIDLCPNPDEVLIKVDINGKSVKINMKEKVKEFVHDGILYGYLLHVDLPTELSNNKYDIFDIEMEDLKTGDKGKALYFKEK